jgi:phosphoribosylformylglycinamidine synthase
MLLPVAHGEGNFYAAPEILTAMRNNDQVALKYIREDGTPANGEFPYSPNGALEDIAAITDPSGRLFGLMPHPERLHQYLNYPNFPENKDRQKLGEGLKIFKNAVEYFS